MAGTPNTPGPPNGQPPIPPEKISVKKETGLLLKHSSIYGMAPAVSRLLGFLMIPLYLEYLSPADYGVMDLLYTTTSLIEMVVGVGVAYGVARFYFDSDIQSERNKVISSAFLGLGGLLVPVVAILIIASSFFASVILDSKDYDDYFVLAFLTMGLGMLNQINLAYLRAEKRSLTVVISTVSQVVINLSLNVYLIVVQDMGVAGIFWGNLIAVAFTMSWLTPLVLRRVGLGFSVDVVKGLIKFGLPLIPSNIANYIVVASDRYFVKEFVSVSETGIYSLGYKFGSLINNFVTSPFNQIYAPRRLELFKKEDSHELFGKVFTYFVCAITFVGLGISMLSRDVIFLLNDRYHEAYQVVPLLTLGHIALSFFYHFNIGIIISKQTKYFAYINMTNAAVNLALNFILIREYGMWGAAISTTICFALRAAMGYWFSRKFVPVVVEWRRVIIVMVTAFVYYFVFEPMSFGGNVTSAIVKGLICCTFPLMLFVARFFNAEEKAYMAKFLRKLRGR
ncbi:oligosaccharide flippase family protein [candidate division GN15 bacterium]|nr:oligosaccharide flippase family protein [candidate division GN15 bacterium]